MLGAKKEGEGIIRTQEKSYSIPGKRSSNPKFDIIIIKFIIFQESNPCNKLWIILWSILKKIYYC